MSHKPLSPLRALLRTVITWALAITACIVWTAAELPL